MTSGTNPFASPIADERSAQNLLRHTSIFLKEFISSHDIATKANTWLLRKAANEKRVALQEGLKALREFRPEKPVSTEFSKQIFDTAREIEVTLASYDILADESGHAPDNAELDAVLNRLNPT